MKSKINFNQINFSYELEKNIDFFAFYFSKDKITLLFERDCEYKKISTFFMNIKVRLLTFQFNFQS